MRRKLAAWALAVLTLVSVLPPGVAAEPTWLVVGELSAPLKAGETAEITITLENNPGFNAMGFSVAYDNAALICEDAQPGELIAELMSVANPANGDVATVGMASLRTVLGDGPVATLKFRALKDVDKLALKLVEVDLRDAEHNALPLEVKTAEPAAPDSDPSSSVPSGGVTVTPKPTQKPEEKPEEKPEKSRRPPPSPSPSRSPPPLPTWRGTGARILPKRRLRQASSRAMRTAPSAPTRR